MWRECIADYDMANDCIYQSLLLYMYRLLWTLLFSAAVMGFDGIL